MLRTLAITATALLLVSGCGGRPRPSLGRFPGAESVRVKPWPVADPTNPKAPPPPLWPVGTRRVQVAITPYATPEGMQFLVWIVSNGNRLLEVYFVTKAQHDEILTRIGDQRRPSMEVLQLPTRHPQVHPDKHARLCPTCGVLPSPAPPGNLDAWPDAPRPFAYVPGQPGGSGPTGDPPPGDDGDLVLTTTSATNGDIPPDVE